MAAQHCECTKCHQVEHLKMINFILRESHPSEIFNYKEDPLNPVECSHQGPPVTHQMLHLNLLRWAAPIPGWVPTSPPQYLHPVFYQNPLKVTRHLEKPTHSQITPGQGPPRAPVCSSGSSPHLPFSGLPRCPDGAADDGKCPLDLTVRPILDWKRNSCPIPTEFQPVAKTPFTDAQTQVLRRSLFEMGLTLLGCRGRRLSCTTLLLLRAGGWTWRAGALFCSPLRLPSPCQPEKGLCPRQAFRAKPN